MCEVCQMLGMKISALLLSSCIEHFINVFGFYFQMLFHLLNRMTLQYSE